MHDISSALVYNAKYETALIVITHTHEHLYAKLLTWVEMYMIFIVSHHDLR